MPPCGYRIPAIDGIAQFLLDNLEYFIELYTAKGLSIESAIATEFSEIARIRNGVRGGAWSAIVVEINERFYAQLLKEKPSSWEDVRQIGISLIATATDDLRSLTLDSPNASVPKKVETACLSKQDLFEVTGSYV